MNNDICYPSILVTGQIMEAIESGRYDLSKTAVVISQTGGGCRATNYIALIRKALRESGHPEIPVISLSAVALGEDNPGFKLTPALLKQAVYAVLFGDVMMQMLYRCARMRPRPVPPTRSTRSTWRALASWHPSSTGITTPSCAARHPRVRHHAACGRGHQAARGRGR